MTHEEYEKIACTEKISVTRNDLAEAQAKITALFCEENPALIAILPLFGAMVMKTLFEEYKTPTPPCAEEVVQNYREKGDTK